MYTWSKNYKHETGFEPATLALARRYSTTEPLVQFLCLVVSHKHDIYILHYNLIFVNAFFEIFSKKLNYSYILQIIYNSIL